VILFSYSTAPSKNDLEKTNSPTDGQGLTEFAKYRRTQPSTFWKNFPVNLSKPRLLPIVCASSSPENTYKLISKSSKNIVVVVTLQLLRNKRDPGTQLDFQSSKE